MKTSTSLQVVDLGHERPDLAQRQEVKFVFENADVSKPRQVIRRRCSPIVYAGRVSNVYSLYFDDDGLSTCLANLDGFGERHKTRLRWYDRSHPAGPFFFETKWRRHHVMGKRRLQLLAPDLEENFSLRFLHRSLCQVLPPDRLDYLPSDINAVTVVQYQREHFAVDGSDARLTLDYNIRFYPLLHSKKFQLRFPHRLGGVALIECKSKFGENGFIYPVIAPLAARQSRFSKYVEACHKLGFATKT